jgi:hypothetical protein
MTCNHKWVANHNNSNDFGYHCDQCGFDPSDPEKSVRQGIEKKRKLSERIHDFTFYLIVLAILLPFLGYLWDGATGAIFCGIITLIGFSGMLREKFDNACDAYHAVMNQTNNIDETREENR